MSSVRLNRNAAPVGVLLGGTGLARVPAFRPVVLPALLRPQPCTSSCGVVARVPCATGC